MQFNFESDTPIYMQVAEQIKDAILSGAFLEETQVPSTTEISVTYKINPATALKGMTLLTDAGILYKKRGVGMFVKKGAAGTILEQRKNAFEALDEVLDRVKKGEISDFRMVIKGANQRVTNGNTTNLSGRAKELEEKGFYFLFYNPKGSMISDVWQIVPEDTQGRKLHFAPYPEDLVKVPIVLTCPPDGTVLDPFSGTGTTNIVAMRMNRQSIGIDMSEEYIELAKERCGVLDE